MTTYNLFDSEYEDEYLDAYDEFVGRNIVVPKTNHTGLTLPQYSVWKDPTRFRVMCCGRRVGKTILAINELIRAAQTGQRQTVWYVAPTYKMAKRIAWKMLKEAIPKANVLVKNENDLEITIKGFESTISLKGAEDPDALRGDSISFLIMDEVQGINLDAFDTVIRPALADQEGDALFLGTPMGMGDNAMYRLYMRGKEEPDWKSWSYTTLQGGNVSEEEVAAARRTMAPKKFRQEFEASFETLLGRVYYGFDREDSVKNVVDDGYSPLHIGIDFNVNPITAAVCQKHGDTVHVIDEFCIEDSHTRELCQEIKNRYPNRTIYTYPDPSGRNRSTKAGGQTDFTIISDPRQGFGWDALAPNKAPAVADRINDVNSMWLSADGSRKMFVNPKCKEVIKCFDNLTYKEGASTPDKTSNLDHMTDALGYFISYEFPLIKKEVMEFSINWAY